MKQILHNQRKQFDVFNANAKRLLKANFIFGLLAPFYLLFSNTFIFAHSETGDITFNLMYSALHFIGNPLGFILNGYLLRSIHVKYLFITGMVLMVVNMTAMIFLPPHFFTELAVLIFGLISGAGSGMYWSARTYLTIETTRDENRNFFSGLDFVFFIAGGIITPFIIGNYIGLTVRFEWLSRLMAYQMVILFALILVTTASIIIYKGNFDTIRMRKFLKYKFHTSWHYTRMFVFNMGLFHGVLLSLPAIFIMKYVGDESTLGIVESIIHLIAIISIYFVSRYSKVEHRPRIMLYGSVFFLCGALLFSFYLSHVATFAVLALVAAFYFSDPMMNFPYRASFMKSVDEAVKQTGENRFTYIVDIEQFNALGRVVAITVFYITYQLLPEETAFPLVLIGVAFIQILNVHYARRINKYENKLNHFNLQFNQYKN